MGLFDRFKKRENTQQEQLMNEIDQVLEDRKLKLEEININNKEQRDQYVKFCCDQIKIARKELSDTKQEYNLVTTYLSDIQQIEELPLNNKAEVSDLAREIVLLSDERKSFQSAAAKITDLQYSQIELNEEDIPHVLADLEEREKEQSLIKTDLKYLEGEKTSLIFLRKETVKSQKNMKALAIITLFTFIISFLMLFILQTITNLKVSVGYSAVVFCGAIAATAIFVKIRYNVVELKKVDLKINRAISLSNSTKIRYVNATNALDYICSTYNVSGGRELSFIWEQYLAAKAESQRYKLNTADLDFNNRQLIGILTRYKIQAPSIWIHQALALIDDKEMVEVRHNLNVRRQNLRKRVEYNTDMIKNAKKDITKIAATNPEYADEIVDVVKSVEDITEND
ncbi:hypothetical protein C8E03_106119 [Lachnotalea glycerini]|uniref:Uncharacterized protein n=1 Tax=Lachnotalea glycerini TaxID=1763509 RepID=A0A255IM26_9FIRM|nr:hypothetical protein [Lachnotalea glycerini]PXV89468.1 hypothetical protein C8E03_106119 [Lachnotalea glycerini]RDY32346.1 hypothetical protein CG710_005030 [Lachnotalea glycerini]